MPNANDWPITISLPQGFTIGGVTTWAIGVARIMSRRGRRVRLVAHPPLAGHTEFDPHESICDERIEIVRAPDLTTPDGFRESLRIYAAICPTILLPHLGPASYAIAAELTRSHRDDVRVIGWVHGDNPEDYAYLEYYEPIIARFAAVSSQCQRAMRSRLPHRVRGISHIPHGIESHSQSDRTTKHQSPLRIIYAGRMEQGIKRVVDILAIAIRLAEQDIPFEMRLIGDGPHANFVTSRIAALNTGFASTESARIRYESAIPPHQMDDAWRWADVFLLASRLEGFSIAMVEAMAAGCVPIVTRIASGPADIIREGQNGMMFPVGDIDVAVDCIQILAADPSRLHAMSNRARESVATSLSPDVFADRFSSVIDAVVMAPPREWPADKPLNMPRVDEQSGAISTTGASQPYDAVVQFIEDRADAKDVIIYGLGVNGITLVDRLRDDFVMKGRRLFGADDQACPAVHKSIGSQRFEMNSIDRWPADSIAIVTPNIPAPLISRLRNRGAVQGHDFTCLHESTSKVKSIPREPITNSSPATKDLGVACMHAPDDSGATGQLAANASELQLLQSRHQNPKSQPYPTGKRKRHTIAE